MSSKCEDKLPLLEGDKMFESESESPENLENSAVGQEEIDLKVFKEVKPLRIVVDGNIGLYFEEYKFIFEIKYF